MSLAPPLDEIPYLYHFTDSRNTKSISETGICSRKRLLEMKIGFVPGGDSLSAQLDADNGLDAYVHLSFTAKHPMEQKAWEEGRIRFRRTIKVKPEILNFPGVRFYPGM